MSAASLIRQHSRLAAFALLEQGEEVGNRRVRVMQTERYPVRVAARSQHHAHGFPLDLHTRRSIGQQDRHFQFPQSFQRVSESGHRTVVLTTRRLQHILFTKCSSYRQAPHNHQGQPCGSQSLTRRATRSRNAEACAHADNFAATDCQKHSERQYTDKPIPLSTHIRGETSRGVGQ